MDIGSPHVHSSWKPVLEPFSADIARILGSLQGSSIAPAQDRIFAALEVPLSEVRCVIIGQDPYPTAGNAHGLAFSIPDQVAKIPASLKNIFKELHSDLGLEIPQSGNLEKWRDQGVLLLNRILTTEVGRSNAHSNLGWQVITKSIAEAAGDQNAVSILWGKEAQALAPVFKDSITSVHPSPLSAYRGFFGSKPFSKVNEALIRMGREPIDWRL
ncbi:MAG: uracil-DNA glycosylase [Candidatus Planktophila sp.]|jgi:uracil-DNA glycosylase